MVLGAWDRMLIQVALILVIWSSNIPYDLVFYFGVLPTVHLTFFMILQVNKLQTAVKDN